MRKVLSFIAVTAIIAGGLTGAVSSPWHGLRAGVGVVDATWHVGAGAGQYASEADPTDLSSEWDPNVQHVKQYSSYGVASRLSIRAIVLQSPGKAPIALVKDDNYLAQDMLVRRVGQILQADGSNVTYENILLSATHNHNSPYYSTPAAGVWLFQDAMDLRMFEYQARGMAKAIEDAERGMRPARMGATTVQYRDYQGNIAGAGVNEDGSPTGYPLGENDHGLTVMRFDDMSNPHKPSPLATYVNYANHGESLDGYDLISEDWWAPFERYVDRATGVPVVFSQGSVGSAEGPYEHAFAPGHVPTTTDHGDTVAKIWAHVGYAQTERGVHLLASKVIAAWQAIGGARDDIPVQSPYDSNPVASMLTHWIAGPLSHPYPSVGNCRTANTLDGDPGVPAAGLPDCARAGDELGASLPPTTLYEDLVAAGVPIPANYDAPSFGSVEENLRIKLQAVRIGKVFLGSCSCEAQSDLIKALETRTDKTQHNKWNGFDYAEASHVASAWPGLDVEPCHPSGGGYDCPDPRDVNGARRLQVSSAAFKHMEAEINNPSDGWDDPAYVVQANSEPADISAIKGNFTSKELSSSCGYAVSVGLGHTGDYDGYTVSYREYMARDAYRKALTSYGSHTADYMVSRLIAMAENLMCGTPLPSEPTDALAAADEVRQLAEATAIGQISSAYFDIWSAQIPDSAGPAAASAQPKDIERFDAATFAWTGGDNWTDNPTVIVQRHIGGKWKAFANQKGEVQTILDVPKSSFIESLGDYRSGSQRWTWIASFEAFDSYPRADVPGGQTPEGLYRFVVDGFIHQGGAVEPYHLTSESFTVSPWTGLTAKSLKVNEDGSVSFVTGPVTYPRTYKSPIKFVHDDLGGINAGAGDNNASILCRTCTFRPWATSGEIVKAIVTVRDSNGHIVRTVAATFDGSKWTANAHLAPGQTAEIRAGGLEDSYGETNGDTIGPVTAH